MNCDIIWWGGINSTTIGGIIYFTTFTCIHVFINEATHLEPHGVPLQSHASKAAMLSNEGILMYICTKTVVTKPYFCGMHRYN